MLCYSNLTDNKYFNPHLPAFRLTWYLSCHTCSIECRQTL